MQPYQPTPAGNCQCQLTCMQYWHHATAVWLHTHVSAAGAHPVSECTYVHHIVHVLLEHGQPILTTGHLSSDVQWLGWAGYVPTKKKGLTSASIPSLLVGSGELVPPQKQQGSRHQGATTGNNMHACIGDDLELHQERLRYRGRLLRGGRGWWRCWTLMKHGACTKCQTGSVAECRSPAASCTRQRCCCWTRSRCAAWKFEILRLLLTLTVGSRLSRLS